MVRPADIVGKPLDSAVRVKVCRVIGEELGCFRPQCRQRLGVIVECDCEAVRLVVVLHVSEDIVVHIAKEVDIWFDTPVVSSVLKCRMFIKHSAVPSTHLVVRHHVCVLDALFLEDGGGCVEHAGVDPGRRRPMFVGNDFCSGVREEASLFGY